MDELSFVILFDGVCDQAKKLQILSGSMSNDAKWIISSSGHYMFVRFAVDIFAFESTKFLAKIHYGNQILNIYYYKKPIIITVSRLVN